VYIKHHLPIDKQFSIDSFLDWEGLHWDLTYHDHLSARLPSPLPHCFRSDARSIKRAKNINCSLHSKKAPKFNKIIEEIKFKATFIYQNSHLKIIKCNVTNKKKHCKSF